MSISTLEVDLCKENFKEYLSVETHEDKSCKNSVEYSSNITQSINYREVTSIIDNLFLGSCEQKVELDSCSSGQWFFFSILLQLISMGGRQSFFKWKNPIFRMEYILRKLMCKLLISTSLIAISFEVVDPRLFVICWIYS